MQHNPVTILLLDLLRAAKQNLGIGLLLIIICLVTTLANPKFVQPYNLENTIRWTSLFGIISIGVAFVIITGGIDLSIGSVIGLTGCLLPMFLDYLTVPAAVGAILLIALGLGITHGLLITQLNLKPFVVTLCGLLIYRGLARFVTGDEMQGFGNQYPTLKLLAKGQPFSVPVPGLRWISQGNWGPYLWNFDEHERVLNKVGKPVPLDFIEWIAVPAPAIILLLIALVAAVVLNYTTFGRYLFALGRNEQAARYSGINTNLIVLASYGICSLLAGVAGILFTLDLNSAQPSSHGDFYELYAIAAAVLGGCSLRGGEGSVLGVVIGAAVMRVLRNSINLVGIPTQLEFAIIGFVILAGVIGDELVRRIAARNRARAEAALAEATPGERE